MKGVGNDMESTSRTKNRGFASMDAHRQREIARKGGRAAHEKGKAHEFTAEEARAAGLSALDAARQTDLGEYAEWLDPERIVGNLHRALVEADGGERGAELDVVAALRDMVAYNGGPLRCYA